MGPFTRVRFLKHLTIELLIAAVAVLAIMSHVLMRFVLVTGEHPPTGVNYADVPLLIAIISGSPLLFGLIGKLLKLDFSSDLLAGISIVTSVILGEYLATRETLYLGLAGHGQG